MKNFLQALSLIREGRKLARQGRKLTKAGYQSGVDRIREGTAKVMKGHWLLGKLSDQGYAEFLKS